MDTHAGTVAYMCQMGLLQAARSPRLVVVAEDDCRRGAGPAPPPPPRGPPTYLHPAAAICTAVSAMTSESLMCTWGQRAAALVSTP
jgi:hypothetical protein